MRDGSSWTAGGAGSSRNGAGGIDGCCLGSMMEAVKSHDCSSILLLMSDCKRALENKSKGLRRLSNPIWWYTRGNPSVLMVYKSSGCSGSYSTFRYTGDGDR